MQYGGVTCHLQTYIQKDVRCADVCSSALNFQWNEGNEDPADGVKEHDKSGDVFEEELSWHFYL